LIKKFGKWIGHKQSYFEIAEIKDCNDKYKVDYILDELEKNQTECLISIDLANTGDTNAITLVFKDVRNEEIIPIFFSKVFVPKTTIDDRIIKERKPYNE
jgi:phage terminase large subunit-like protein